jgi:hypothetical protein
LRLPSPAADGADGLPPLLVQAAFLATPMLFLGLPLWIVELVLRLLDLDARTILFGVGACVIPPAVYLFAGLALRTGLVRRDASPLAITLALVLGAALAAWLVPQLAESWGSPKRIGGRDGGSFAGVAMVAIIVAAVAVALRWFPRKGGTPR